MLYQQSFWAWGPPREGNKLVPHLPAGQAAFWCRARAKSLLWGSNICGIPSLSAVLAWTQICSLPAVRTHIKHSGRFCVWAGKQRVLAEFQVSVKHTLSLIMAETSLYSSSVCLTLSAAVLCSQHSFETLDTMFWSCRFPHCLHFLDLLQAKPFRDSMSSNHAKVSPESSSNWIRLLWRLKHVHQMSSLRTGYALDIFLDTGILDLITFQLDMSLIFSPSC